MKKLTYHRRNAENAFRSHYILHSLCLLLISGFLISISGCKKTVSVDSPATSVNSANVYNQDYSAAQVLSGIYSTMSNTFETNGPTKIGVFAGLSSDEFGLYDFTNDLYRYTYYNQLTALNTPSGIWDNLYGLIYRCNAAIEGLNASGTLTPGVKQQLLGEAKFCRAFFYFYLTNLYGDVPLALSSDYKVNSTLTRSKASDVYLQIIADLKDAQQSMSDNYVGNTGSGASTERVRPTKGAATALLARTYLYTKDYTNAELQATAVIGNTALYDTVALNTVFLKNSKETIWSLQPVVVGRNTDDAQIFVITARGLGVANPIYLSSNLINTFKPGDKRLSTWIGSLSIGGKTYYYPYKYKVYLANQPITEYTMVLRLGEQYLIRAEARANTGNINGALSDLNVIRKRAGLVNTTSSTKEDLLASIEKERQTELFSEWGHRWFDLKRTRMADAVMSIVTPVKGGTWQDQDQLYPIPHDEILLNSNLSQNPGY